MHRERRKETIDRDLDHTDRATVVGWEYFVADRAVSVGPYALALTGAFLLVDWPRGRRRRQTSRAPALTRSTLR
jgi:hypothetical protein